MKKVYWYIKAIIHWLKNIKKIIFFREFFIYYLDKVSDLKIPKDKQYLSRFSEFITGYCPRQFTFYAPTHMDSFVKAVSEKAFTDRNSRELYRLVFLRSMYASHFIGGWDKNYYNDKVFETRLSKIKSTIIDNVGFTGNFFTSKTKVNNNYVLNFTNGSSYTLPLNWFEVSVFSFKLGLTYLEDKYLQYIQGKYIIDVGAFIGDSSIVLSEYTNKKVFAVEPGTDNYTLLLKTIDLNRLNDKIDTFNMALDKIKRKVSILNAGAGSGIIESNKPMITTTTIDNLVKGKNHTIGLIKMDVEGYEMNILLGSKKIIRRDQPVLLISIYHNADQFINIPLYFKEHYSDIYTFKFLDCNPVHPLSEKVLLCLPKKI